MGAERIDELLEQAVRDGVFPGVIAAVADRDGLIYDAAFGHASLERGTPAVPDSMIWIASMTKALASVAALQLIEQRRLSVEQPVGDVLPAFDELKVLEGFDGDTPRLRPPSSRATIRQLFTHTSGLGYWWCNEDLLRYHEIMGLPDPVLGRRTVLNVPLITDPGTRWEYSTSIDWLGQVIEKVSGQDLATYCEEHIFGPLGMTDTTFRPTAEQQARRMELYSRAPDGGLVPSTIQPPEHPEFWPGGSGAYSTARDYARFMRMLMRDGELDGVRVLRPETAELAFTDHIQGIPTPDVQRSSIPVMSNDVPALPVAQGYGLGLHLIFEDIPGMRHSGTGDWAGLANCFYWIDRTGGVAATLLTQVLPFFDPPIVQALLAFEQAVYAEVGAPATA